MEPQYMIIGQAAGVAAAMALYEKKPVQDIDPHQLTARLKAQGTVIEDHPSATSPAFFHGLWQKFQPNESRVRTLP
jgi:hypothetical protein